VFFLFGYKQNNVTFVERRRWAGQGHGTCAHGGVMGGVSGGGAAAARGDRGAAG
jgi:hypothetical protein